MKRDYFFKFLIVAQIVTSCNRNNVAVNNDLKEWKLRGAVKSISEINYSNGGKYATYLLFNPDGFIQEQSTFNPDSSLIRKWKYKYNTQNQKLIRFCYVLNDSLSEILHYSYNKKNKITEEKLLNTQGGLISDVIHEYGANQNEIERRFKDEKAKIQDRILYRYDDKNNIIEELNTNFFLHQYWKQKNIYNPEGLNVEILYLSLNDSLVKRLIYTYLSNKQVGEVCSYDGKNELISKTSYEYDKLLSITSKLTYSPPDSKTEKRTFEYKYDKNKNWTSLKEYLDNELVDIIIRKFEYYQ
jgi:hypothetical protein